jgi:hypothetical protein
MPKISEFLKSLIDLNKCVLCKQDYDLAEKMPRILVHCGHTFCTECLIKFHQEFRIRCPLCLKLIRNIDVMERVPINHTVFTNLCEKINEQNRPLGIEPINPKETLLGHF